MSAMTIARGILIALGVATIAWGAFVLFSDVAVERIPGVALWLAVAIVIHDAIISPLVFAVGILIRRAGGGVSGGVVLVVEGAIVVSSVVSLIVVPMIVAQGYAPENPSLLPFDYGVRLGLFWLVVAVLTAGASVWLYARTKRANQRPPDRQS